MMTSAPQSVELGSSRIPRGLYWATAVLIFLLCIPLPSDLPVAGHRMLAILAFAIVLWATEAVSYEVSAMLLTALIALLIGDAPDIAAPEISYGTARALGMALAGFSNAALALVAAALFIAAAMSHTRLDQRIALLILAKMGTRIRNVLLGTIVITIVLSFVVPSATARSACIIPIMLGVITAFNVDRRSNTAAAIILTVAHAISIWNIGVMTAAAQNFLISGFIDQLLGQRIAWLQWLIAGVPWCLIMSVILYYTVRFFVPPEMQALPGGKAAIQQALEKLGPMTAAQKRLAAVSLGLLICWATEGTLHSIDVTTVTLLGLVLLVFPRFGVMEWKALQAGTPWGTLVVFGTGISMGTALLNTHAAQWLGRWVVTHAGLADHGVTGLFAVLAAFLIVVHLGFASATALASAMIPILIAVLQALPTEFNRVGLTMLLGFVISFGFILPINAPQNMVCLGTNTFNVKQFAKVGIVLTIVGYGLMVLFSVTYWPWLGWI